MLERARFFSWVLMLDGGKETKNGMAMFWQQIISFVSFEFPLLQFSNYIEFDFKHISLLRNVYVSQFIYFLFRFSVTQRKANSVRFL